MAGAEDTIYLCNFRVSVDGDWLCLKELAEGGSGGSGATANQERSASTSPGSPPPSGAYPRLPPGSSSLHALTQSKSAAMEGPDVPSDSPPTSPGSPCEGAAVGGAGGGPLSLLPGLPPGLFAPYVPLTCGPSARFLPYVATLLMDTLSNHFCSLLCNIYCVFI